MPWGPPIFLAASEGVGLDLVVWLIAGAIWLFSQMAAAKQRQKKKGRPKPPQAAPRAGPQSDAGDAPTPDELAEIFKRLGADIPATPPPPPPAPRPVPRPAPRPARPPDPAPAPRMAPKPAPRLVARKPAATPGPAELAQRLARVRKEAEAAARAAEAERPAFDAGGQGVPGRADESHAGGASARHSGVVLPRLQAMSLRLTPWPTLPMPGFDHSHHAGKPFRPRLHARREVRDALIAQTLLQPAKGLAR